MQKRVSVKDIAQELNISLSTVHKALTGKGGIGEERRREVLETARRMGYEVNSVAQSLARKDITLGILMPSRWQDYFEDMKAGMEAEIQNLQKYKVRGIFFDLSADPTGEKAEQVLERIREKQIDALIYCPTIYPLQETFLKSINKAKVPVFMAGDNSEEFDCVSSIITDAVLSGKIAADFLRCMKGDTLKAVVFTGALQVKAHKEKVEAFTKRVEGFGGRVEVVCETEDDPERAYEAAKQVCGKDIDAVYVTTATSIPICKYLEEMHLEQQVALICTDLFEELKDYMKKNVANATIYQNQEKVGRMAVRSAYDYLVRSNSYGGAELKPAEVVYIRPNLYLLADIEQ